MRKYGGAGRIRTGDILLAKQALYQLSYDPILVEITVKEHTLEIYFVRSIGTQNPKGFFRPSRE
jgi:hypothetical protein